MGALLTIGINENFIPWTIAFISLVVTIYSMVKRGTKDDTSSLTTVIVKLENIQRAVDKTSDMIVTIQAEMKSLDRRITKLETIDKMERALEKNDR